MFDTTTNSLLTTKQNDSKAIHDCSIVHVNELNRHVLSLNLRIDFVHQNILGNEHLPNLNFVLIGSS